MNKIELFPALLSTFNYDNHDVFKQTYLEHANKYVINDLTGEAEGVNLVHHNPAFADFYAWVASCSKQYLEELNINLDKMNIVMAKSWLSFVDADREVPFHSHADHHLSFIYYVNAPAGCDYINFGDPRGANLNEPFHGAFEKTFDNIIEYNRYNSRNHYFPANEGQLWIFPSKMNHWTTRFTEFEGVRQAIAGDLLLIYNDINNKTPFGMYSQEYWKFYDPKAL